MPQTTTPCAECQPCCNTRDELNQPTAQQPKATPKTKQLLYTPSTGTL
jgi:hypothetical protein